MNYKLTINRDMFQILINIKKYELSTDNTRKSTFAIEKFRRNLLSPFRNIPRNYADHYYNLFGHTISHLLNYL